MNRLQKNAWMNLVFVTGCIVLAGAGVGFMVHLNVRGITGLVSFVISGLITGLATGLWSIRTYSGFDERERKIAQKAANYARFVQTVFWALASFVTFFIAGARESIPVYVLPVLFLCGIFLAAFVQSATVLIQFTREQADG
ncbi:MAG: hypothetical protein KAT00_08255 [Planctomycetes bacterium]|nr:hypothetical protein [Planctomycetota bacterium]